MGVSSHTFRSRRRGDHLQLIYRSEVEISRHEHLNAIALRDRRVKTVVLTPLGITTRDRLHESFYDPPAALLGLDVASLESLRDELGKLPAPPRHEGGAC